MSIVIPPNMTDKYILYVRCDGTRVLEKFSPNQKPGDKDFILNFADISNAVTQRMSDYHFYFGNLCATNPSDVPAVTAATAQLMDVFSKNMTLFNVTNSTTPIVSFTTDVWKQTSGFFQYVASSFFQGYSQHNALNVRINPIFDCTTSQAAIQCHLIQNSRFIDNPPTSPVKYIADFGEYNIKWAYESDNVWRIVSWQFNDRFSVNQPTPYLLATPYVPSQNVSNTC